MQHSLVSVFTPSLMSAEDLEHIFVQREPLAQDLIRRIVDSTKGRGKEHSMLIGMRGMGKTHLVSLVYHRVKAMPELNDKLLIAWLREEEWGVDSWLDLVMRIFRAVAEDRGSADSGMAKNLLDRFYKEGFESAKGSATKFLRDLIGKRTLLLIIENMDDLFQGLGEQGQQEFRAFLQEYRCCTVLATTPAMFRGVESREMPFYGFFHPCYLESIDVDEAVKMLSKIASLTTVKDSHHDLAVYLQSAEGRSRVRAVHHLAGGNPRVYTLFSQFISRESLDDLVDAFMKMLDDLTPYYQARMKELSNQQRKILELLIDRRQAVMVKDIGDACFIDQRAVASQLRELKKKGYVVSNEVGRESFYELREVLMRFCMEVKKFRGRWVELILDFLKIWYRPDQRSGLFKKFSDSKFMNTNDWVKLVITNDDPVSDICSREFIKALKGKEKPSALKLVEELKSIGSIKDKDYQTITELIRNSDFKEAQFVQALVFFRDNKTTCLKLLDDLLDSDSSFYKASYAKGIILSGERNWIESIKFFDQTIAIKPEYSEAWYHRGVALCQMGNHEDAVISYDNYIAINPTNFEVWASRATCQCTLGKYEESLASCDKALAIKTALHETWNTQACALYNLGRYEESIISLGQAIAIKPDEPEYPHNMGIYYFKLGKYSESIDFFQQAISVQLDRYDFWHDKGFVQFVTSDYQAALASWQQAFNYISDSAVPRYQEDISGLIQEFIEALIPRFTQPSIQQTILIPLLEIYKESNVITELGAALVNTLHLIVAPTISDHTAAEWLSLWRTSSLGNEPAMELPLRLMSTAVEYKKDPSKRQRLWLNLPSEERPILDKALKI